MKELIEAIDQGWDVEFTNESKRLEGDDGWRDFFLRTMWKATNWKVIGHEKNDELECEWEGFATAEEAVNDFIEKIKPKLKK